MQTPIWPQKIAQIGKEKKAVNASLRLRAAVYLLVCIVLLALNKIISFFVCFALANPILSIEFDLFRLFKVHGVQSEVNYL